MVNPPLHFEFRISISAEQGTTPTAEDTVRLQETPTDETPPPKKKRRESPEQASTWKPALNENIDPSATDPQPQQSSAMSPRQNFQRN